MPIYEYKCPSCGVIEAVQGITEKPLTRCPKCGKRKVKKLISESSFHLKGSGWYTTDYGRSKGDNGGNGGNGKTKPGEKSDHAEKGAGSAAKESASKDSSAKDSSTKESASPKAEASTSSSG